MLDAAAIEIAFVGDRKSEHELELELEFELKLTEDDNCFEFWERFCKKRDFKEEVEVDGDGEGDDRATESIQKKTNNRNPYL